MDTPPIVSIRRLTKHYGAVRAVDGISFDVRDASVFTLLGPNGAGKTTTLEILEGIRRPNAGDLTVFGRTVRHVDRGLKEEMGVLLQEGGFEPYLRVREVLQLFSSFFRRPRPIEEVLADVALTEKASALVRTLSGGQKQRLAIATALINDPRLVFLDEPTTGLDPQARRNIWAIAERLRTAGKAIILTTHYMEEAEALSDDVAVMDHGTIIATGTPRELCAQLGQTTIIEFDASGVGSEELSTLQGCCRAIRQDGSLVVAETDDFLKTMEHLLAWSANRAEGLRDITVRQPNLEDVFLTLTGRRLRE